MRRCPTIKTKPASPVAARRLSTIGIAVAAQAQIFPRHTIGVKAAGPPSSTLARTLKLQPEA